MGNKVTAKKFIKIQLRVLRDLMADYKKESLIIIGLSWVVICFELVDFKILEYMTDRININDPGKDSFWQIVLTAAGVFAALVILKIIYDYRSGKYIFQIGKDIEMKFVRHVSRIEYEHYEKADFYNELDMASQAGGQYSQAVTCISEFVKILVLLVMYGVLLSAINPFLLLAILLIIVLCSICAAMVKDKQLDFYRRNVSPMSRKSRYFGSIFKERLNHQNIQFSQSFHFFSQKMSRYNSQVRRKYLQLNLLSFFSEFITSFLFLFVFLFAILYTENGVVKGNYTIGYFCMVLAMLGNLFQVIKRYTAFLIQNNWYVNVLNEYYKIMDISIQNSGKEELPHEGIEVEQASYRYPGTEGKAVEQLSLRIKPGEKVAIVGENGSGKTTLISMLLHLLEPEEGKIAVCFGGVKAIMQEFGQYQMSIKENVEIGVGGRELSDEFVCRILDQVGLMEKIQNFPNGIYTKLGEINNGTELSKGQWQRLAIARLLADKEAAIWILDEPTAYLDPISEIEMYKLIFQLAGREKTVLFISHRLGFAQFADYIVLMKAGRVAEVGTHRELMAADGEYSRMFTVQKKWYE